MSNLPSFDLEENTEWLVNCEDHFEILRLSFAHLGLAEQVQVNLLLE